MIFPSTAKRFAFFMYFCNMNKRTATLLCAIRSIKKRHCLLALLLVAVTLCRTVTGWGDAYVHHVYPHIGHVLSSVSGLFPFACGDLFIAASIIGVIVSPLYRKFHCHKTWWKALLPVGEYLLWLYVWFYAAWGLSYSQSNIYRRMHMIPVEVSEDEFRRFAYAYADSTNASYTVTGLSEGAGLSDKEEEEEKGEKEAVWQYVPEAYRRLDHKAMGINTPFNAHPKVKTMVFSRLSSMAGVTGSMGPFFCEFTLNADVLRHNYPFTYAHEFSHWLGIANEGEANFYAYLVCTASAEKKIRFSGYYNILPHIINNVYFLLGEKECDAFASHLRPEIRQMLRHDRLYWQAKRNKMIDYAQDIIYEWYLRGNKVEGGRKSYSTVVGIIMAYNQHKTENYKNKATRQQTWKK